MNWKYIYIDNREEMIMSGWKLYVYGETPEAANLSARLILNTVKRYNLTTKIATKDIIKRNKNKNIPWGIAVIYLTEVIFRDKLFLSLIGDLTEDLEDYNYSGRIKGAKRITDKIYLRYDLIKKINPRIGISYNEYTIFYKGEY